MVKNLLAMQETRVPSLDQKDPLEKEMATHSSVLAWRIPGTEEPGGLQSTGSQRVRHNPLQCSGPENPRDRGAWRAAVHGVTQSQTQRGRLTHTHIQTHAYTDTHTRTHIHAHTHRHTHIHTYTHIHTQTNRDTQRDTHTYTHTQTHTYTQSSILKIANIFYFAIEDLTFV